MMMLSHPYIPITDVATNSCILSHIYDLYIRKFLILVIVIKKLWRRVTEENREAQNWKLLLIKMTHNLSYLISLILFWLNKLIDLDDSCVNYPRTALLRAVEKDWHMSVSIISYSVIYMAKVMSGLSFHRRFS